MLTKQQGKKTTKRKKEILNLKIQANVKWGKKKKGISAMRGEAEVNGGDLGANFVLWTCECTTSRIKTMSSAKSVRAPDGRKDGLNVIRNRRRHG